VTITCANVFHVFIVTSTESNDDKLPKFRTHFQKGVDWVLRESLESEAQVSNILNGHTYILVPKNHNPCKCSHLELERSRTHVYAEPPLYEYLRVGETS
jgi:hypothetical protein